MKATLLAMIVLGASAPMAHAGEPIPPKARKLAERGRELHERGDYAGAIIAFKEAYVLAPSTGLLFNLAQAYRLYGNCDDAALMYRRYIAATPASSDERLLAEGHLATVVQCQKKRGVRQPDASLTNVSLTAPGATVVLEDRPPAAPSDGKVLRGAGIGVAIGGAAALGAAAYFGVRARQASSEVERLYAEGASWQDIQPIHERGQRSESRAKWLGIGGGVGAAAGITMYVLGRRAEHSSPLTIAPAKGGAQVGLSWVF